MEGNRLYIVEQQELREARQREKLRQLVSQPEPPEPIQQRQRTFCVVVRIGRDANGRQIKGEFEAFGPDKRTVSSRYERIYGEGSVKSVREVRRKR